MGQKQPTNILNKIPIPEYVEREFLAEICCSLKLQSKRFKGPSKARMSRCEGEVTGTMKSMVGLNKRVSAKGEIESQRLACSFTNWGTKWTAVHRAQGPLLSNGDKETESEGNTNSQRRDTVW